MKKAVSMFAGIAVLTLGIGLLTGSRAEEAATMVPAAEYPRLVAQSTRVIQESLASNPLDLKTANKARVAAVLIAAYAQNAPGPADQRATLRDTALKLAAAIDERGFIADPNKQEAARKLAQGLASIQPDPAAKAEPVPFTDKHIFIDEVMSLFKAARSGGQGLESSLNTLGKTGQSARALPATSMNPDTVLLAYQTAIAARLTREHKPPRGQKAWDGYAAAMEQAALDLATAAQAQNGQAAYAAIGKLSASCVKCHEDFR